MQKPYGTWPSPFSAARVAASSLRFGAVSVDGEDIYWLETRPRENGRTVLVRRDADGGIHDITPAPFNVRTRVHEYGGGAYVVAGGVAYCSNFADQRLYRFRTTEPEPPAAVTPAGPWCFADAVVDSARRRLICVREDRSDPQREPANELVSLPLGAGGESAGAVIASGYDFYSTPRLSGDGAYLSWLCWRHPNMPWDATELWVADVAADGALTAARRIAGGSGESVYQPGWLADGSLCFSSDRDGWWRLYRVGHGGSPLDGPATPLLGTPPDDAEFGRPQWVLGTATWAGTSRGQVVTAFTCRGRWYLAAIDPGAGTFRQLGDGGVSGPSLPRPPHDDTPEPAEWLAVTSTHAVLVASWVTRPDAVVRVDLDSGRLDVVRTVPFAPAERECLSVPIAIEFPASDGRTAHAFYYAPRHPICTAPDGERPPLIVIGHGGPTTATRDTLDLKVQFWTSRGFAVVDVNYSGSSGYGRAYRRRLNGQWGLVDAGDLIHAARHLVEQGKADPRRLIIRGGSAGGFTALSALTSHPGVFGAGASYYGICDLEVLARDTHKFEARYLESMIGPYPEMREVYRERSPIHFVDRLSCALILFQGLEDKVVPPNQSEMMAAAVRVKGLPVAYLSFAGEQHGFRRADTIVRSLEAELYFYGAVFGFGVADAIDPPPIDNL